jgi:hypothetical protein
MAAAVVAAVKAVVVAVKASAVATYIVATVAVVGTVSYLSKRSLAKAMRENKDSIQGMTFNVKSPDAARRIIYGQVRVGGVLVYSTTEDRVENGKTFENEYLYQVYALADTAHVHSVTGAPQPALSSLVSLAFDKEYIANHTGNNNFIYTSEWAKANTANQQSDHLKFEFFDGSQTTASPLMLETSDWTSSHILKGVAYVACRFKFDQEKFQQGLPNVSCLVRGRKVYNGALGTSPDQPETWFYNTNSAACLADYIRDPVYGLGESQDVFDSARFSTAISVCAENISQTPTMKSRYTCNGIINTDQTLQSNIEDLLSSMAGALYYSSGKFIIAPKVPTDSSYYPNVESATVDEDMMVGGVKLVTKSTRRNQYNTVQGKFASEENKFVVASFPTRQNTSYIADDGQKLTLDITLPFTTNNADAQRIAQITLESSRQQATIQLELSIEAMKFMVGDLINVKYEKFGYNTKTFQIQNMRFVPHAERGIYVQVTALEEDSNAYVWDSSDEIVFQNIQALSRFDGGTVSAPSGIFAEYTVVADNILNTTPKIAVTINDEPNAFITHYQLYIYPIPAAGVGGHEQYLIDSTEFTLNKDYANRKRHLVDVVDDRTGHYRVAVQAVNILGVYSPVTTFDFEITKQQQNEISDNSGGTVIIVQQTGALDPEPNEADVEEAKGSPISDNDTVIYQQVDDNNEVIDSVIYEFNSGIKIFNLMAIYSMSHPAYFSNLSRVFVDVWVEANTGITGGTWSAQVTNTQNGGTQSLDAHTSTTIYDNDLDIQTLYNETVDGYDVYRANDFLVNVQPMSTTRYIGQGRQKAMFRFEVDAQYVNHVSNDYNLMSEYQFRYTIGQAQFNSSPYTVRMQVTN